MRAFLRGLASIFDLVGVFGPSYEDLQMLRRGWKEQDAEWAKLFNQARRDMDLMSTLNQVGIFIDWIPAELASEILQSTEKQESLCLSLASFFKREMQVRRQLDMVPAHVVWRSTFSSHEVVLFDTGSLIINWGATQGPIPSDLVDSVKLHLGAADM